MVVAVTAACGMPFLLFCILSYLQPPPPPHPHFSISKVVVRSPLAKARQSGIQTPNTGLRHPSFNHSLEEGAGKRSSECESNPLSLTFLSVHLSSRLPPPPPLPVPNFPFLQSLFVSLPPNAPPGQAWSRAIDFPHRVLLQPLPCPRDVMTMSWAKRFLCVCSTQFHLRLESGLCHESAVPPLAWIRTL